MIDKSKAVCKICSAALKYVSTTSNLGNHLRIKHQISGASEAIKPKEGEPKQSSIKEAFGVSAPLSKSKKEALDNAVEDYISYGLCPLSTVDDESFVKLIKTVEPRYSVPTRNTVVSRLRKRYEAMTLQLSALLLTKQLYAITHDSSCTSLATQSFCAITLHFFTVDWKLKSICLETAELSAIHTAENLAASIRTAQAKWKFPNPIVACDNAANELVKTFQLLKWNRISCFGHNLNLAVRSCLKYRK